MKNTALQVANFNFYGDDLIALRDNATGDIYTPINNVLKNIGFSDKQQIRKRRDRMINDAVISKGIAKFRLPSTDIGVPKKDTHTCEEVETYCISNRKLPLALAKINITPRMRREQPDLSLKLELYQDKCADVLASVFIDKNDIGTDMSQLIDSIYYLTEAINIMQQDINELKQSQVKRVPPVKKYTRWKTNTFNKIKRIQEYVNDNANENFSLPQIMSIIFNEFQDTYDIDINEYTDMYKCEYGISDEAKVQALDVINHYKDIKDSYSLTVNSIMERLHIEDDYSGNANIFDALSMQTEKKYTSH